MNNTITFFLLTIVIISGLSIGLFNFFSELSDTYSSTVTQNIESEEEQLIKNIDYTKNVTEQITDPLQQQLTATSEQNILENIAGFFVGSVVSAVLLLINVPNLMIGFITMLTSPLAMWLPAWVMTMTYGVITLLLVLLIIKIIMKIEV